MIKLTLSVLDGTYAICKLPSNEEIPNWAKGNFLSLTRTDEELSIVCEIDGVPEGIDIEKSYKCLKVEGPLDFSLTGILSSLSTTLSNKDISIFTISTFNTDYLLVKVENIDKSLEALTKAGHSIS